MRTSEWQKNEDRARDFYAKFGFVFAAAQTLERVVMGVLNSHMAFTQSGRVSKETIADLRRKIEKRTLGPLINEMKSAFKFTDTDLTKLTKALEHRNDLAHGFFWKNGRTMVAPYGLEKLTDELDEMTRTILEATRIADAAYNALLRHAGLDGPEHEAAFQRHLREEYERIQREG